MVSDRDPNEKELLGGLRLDDIRPSLVLQPLDSDSSDSDHLPIPNGHQWRNDHAKHGKEAAIDSVSGSLS